MTKRVELKNISAVGDLTVLISFTCTHFFVLIKEKVVMLLKGTSDFGAMMIARGYISGKLSLTNILNNAGTSRNVWPWR